jgi:hypothetical protein
MSVSVLSNMNTGIGKRFNELNPYHSKWHSMVT